MEKIRALGLRPVTGRFLSQSRLVRHDSDQPAEMITRVINRQARPRFWMLDRRL